MREEAHLDGERRRLGAVGGGGLGDDVLNVDLDCPRAEDQASGAVTHSESPAQLQLALEPPRFAQLLERGIHQRMGGIEQVIALGSHHLFMRAL